MYRFVMFPHDDATSGLTQTYDFASDCSFEHVRLFVISQLFVISSRDDTIFEFGSGSGERDPGLPKARGSVYYFTRSSLESQVLSRNL